MSKSVVLLLVLLLTASGMITFLPVNAGSRTIVVPDDYSTISAAISNAVDGDTVFVKKGNYSEQKIVIKKSISLIGEDAINTRINLDPPWVVSPYEGIPFSMERSRYDDPVAIEADNVRVSGLTITNNASKNGLFLVLGERNQIVGNIITIGIYLSGPYGIVAQNTLTASVDCFDFFNTIAGNEIVGGSIWIGVGGHYNVVYGNTLTNSDGLGIGGNGNLVFNNTVHSSYGLGVGADASNNILCANRVINCIRGLNSFASEGSNNTFYANFVANNRYGATVMHYFSQVGNSTFFHNNFMNNDEQVNTDATIVLEGTGTYTAYHFGCFDNGVEGNYWSDYDGADTNVDGIGDTPFVIDSNRRDNYPLMTPFDVLSVTVELPDWAYRLPDPLPSPLPLPSRYPYGREMPANASTKPPIITIFNTVVNGNNVTINFKASVGESTTAYSTSINKVYYTTDWNQNETNVYQYYNLDEHVWDTQQRTELSYKLNIAAIPEGNHTITIYALEYGVHKSYIGFFVTGSSSVNFTIDTVPPTVSILSVESITYGSTDVPLNFTVSEPASKISYVLDNQDNVTINGNITLTGLSTGAHTITVYAWDTTGNVGFSETIHFSIAEPFPTTMVVASIASVAVIGIGLLVYFKKRKR